MDNDNEDAPDYCEERDSPATPQSDSVPPPVEVAVLHACSETVTFGLAPTDSSVRITRRAENGNQSRAANVSVFTEASPPAQIKVDQASSESLSLCWETPAGEVKSYMVTCCSEGEIVQELTTDTNSVTFSSLRPGILYSLQVSAQLKNGRMSKPAVTSSRTKTHTESLLEDLGLVQHYKEKLSLSKILEINEKTITDEPAKCNSDLPWYFLQKLMMVNVTARNVKCTSVNDSAIDALSGNTELDLDYLIDSPNSGDMLNPLDIITALFLCSDGFVQQEMALKMSMCQFSVPLLLPNCDKEQCKLMLWALRDIVKKYRPQSLSESKGFIENRIVLSDLPMISFVRLGKCSLSKSEIINKLLSNPQQYHDTFVHHNMECGNSPRRISDGLVEMTWYLPCGNKNLDLFSEPVAVTNLRGDIASFETQYSFLCQTSTAVFVFFDNLDSECKLLTNQHHNAQIFLVGNLQSKRFCSDAVKKVVTELGLNKNVILKTKQMNDAEFVKNMRKKVRDVVENSQKKMQIEQMADIAHELGILVDEDSGECQTAKKNADTITAEIQDILEYKEAELPRQGQIWKELTCLEKEEFRLKHVGSENVEEYKSNLQIKKKNLRGKQNSYDMSNAMTCFISAISRSEIERSYFLKWMRINLDNLSREKLSDLREQYKKKCKSSNTEEIKEIDRKLSNSSLGIEHFFREMGQIYEASVSLPETDPSRLQLQHLPKLCAQLLLDGFPLELVDGDASNIPLRWVSDVLSELNALVSPKSKILVVTVLGVQSTGKSTLLNTMFGVQFAVSSGRCTRGAFMLLIRVNEDVKNILNCDYMVIIDTEGLKSPELAQLDNSHEHDNELATLVVGLSDITIVNIAMENSTEMKDILQIVVHAFLRMKEVGKKPKCQFVHQNVSDVSAHEKNLRDRKLLLQQLNEMTQAAAKMEKKEKNKSFTDVMEYSPDTGNLYIPGLWNGNPPMAPVNAGYSEAVHELKKNIIQMLGNCNASNNISEFTEWMTSLWNAVKHENFIFSFRNSLVADAYMRLCTEFNKWEWEFKKDMYTWVTNAETKISNFGTVAEKSEMPDMTYLLTSLKSEACTELSKWEAKLLENLTQYFKQTEGHVHLVEGHKEDFVNSSKSLRRQIESSVINQLEAAADIRKGMVKLDSIKEKHTKELEGRVCALIEQCRKKKAKMTDMELDKEFDKMWTKTVEELSFSKQKVTDVCNSVFISLRANLSHKGSGACKILSQNILKNCGLEAFKCTSNLIDRLKEFFKIKSHRDVVQKMADSIIAACEDVITQKCERKNNYHETYIQEILHIIDERLEQNQDLIADIEFEVSLKQHICGIAARKFQKMHEDFILVNDPERCLNENKEKFCADFKDVFNERDQCQKKAEEFTERCLKPAVEDFVKRSLGPDIIGEMLTCSQFSTQIVFQYSILLDLFSKNDFENYLSYISSYEDYVKQWTLNQIMEHFSDASKVFEFEDRHIQSSISNINNAIKKAKTGKSGNLKMFVSDICKELGDKLVISQDALGAFMILNKADQEQFADWLTESVKEMAQRLREKFKQTNIENKLKELHVKPQNELFTKLIGCGKQCPFCTAPCEAEGKEHTEHWTSLHRPKGLGCYRWDETKKLVTDICSSSVISDKRFRCSATKDEWHPYKRYKEIFPAWKIAPDKSLEASDYWKYVMAKYNNEFAKAYDAKPADIPKMWKNITRQQAKDSLSWCFSITVALRHQQNRPFLFLFLFVFFEVFNGSLHLRCCISAICWRCIFFSIIKDAPDYCEERDSPATPQSDSVPPPVEVAVLHACSETVTFGLAPTDSSVRYTLHIDYFCNTQSNSVIVEDSSIVDIEGLHPGAEYTFRITRRAENGNQSRAANVSVFTEASPPAQIKVDQVSSESLSLCWKTPAGEVKSDMVTCCSEGEIVQELTTETNSVTFSSLRPGIIYSHQVSAQLKNGRMSKPAVTSSRTKTHTESLLDDLGLVQPYKEKLSLSKILEINEKTITDEPAKCNSDLPWYFLQKLMMVNVTARNVKCTSVNDSAIDALSGNTELDLDYLIDSPNSAVFVFFDNLDSECKLLTNQHHNAQIFLVGNLQSKRFCSDAVKKVVTELGLNNNNVIVKTKQMNDAEFVKNMRKKVRDVVENSQKKMQIEQMAGIAHELGILVDEDSRECQTAKKNADTITAEIQDILEYKEAELPRQGQIWKELTCLEKEEFRLKHVGSENVEEYKSNLQIKKKNLRGKQNSCAMSNAMTCFISAISSSEIERSYFLKWMRINLDNLSREKLSDLREQYKKKCESSNTEEIKDIDRKLSNSSLGIEHFFREMGQIYEASVSLPETDPPRSQLQHLPKLCAQLLLDGFPLELVDGDASNIPLRWVSDVLSELNALVPRKSKILVVTVLGVQSTGKSTLLNTMFGVQFAVSSGRCTRGAFMLLIRVNEDVKNILNCDYMVIIDTEGLKSPELAQLDNSHEHDNELATLVVGLSDITIVNIAMENSTEMKDILQIVVHAFLRMKEVGKKPKCQFVHQNVSDVSAHEKNLRDRKLLLQQLNEMTQAAAKMEKKEKNKSFTDVMEYSPDTGNLYIPGLWNGNPPMAPVNAGYSEAVHELKKNIIQMLGNCNASNNISEFTEWMTTCTELSKWEAKLLENLTQYFKQTEGHVHLVEGHKEDFVNSSKSLRRQIESSVINQLEAAADIRKGMVTDVCNSVFISLRANLSHKGSGACKILSQNILKNCGLEAFKCTSNLIDRLKEFFKFKSHRIAVQKMADSIIAACEDVITQKCERKNNYHETYIQEILHIIDERLEQNQDLIADIEFEVSLKQHICGIAARKFQKMHEDFILVNDPERCLNENKEKFCADFKDVFNERDQCQKKAEEFTERCLKPAVEDFVKRSLGPDIIGEMLTCSQFSTQIVFQYSILLDLFSKNDFENYLSYISSYEDYVKQWTLNQIMEHFSDASRAFEFEDRYIKSSISNINYAIKKAKTGKSGNLKMFVSDICKELGDKLVISQDALGAFMILNKADQEQFAVWLTESVKEMAQRLREKFKQTNIENKLKELHVKPQNELFTKLIGCGKQCPFCTAPCEAEGKEHTEHWTSLHRPKGLGCYRWDETKKLVTDICSSSVISDKRFRCSATKGEWHPYKRYKKIFPAWKIASDISLEASDYWKYVMAEYNNEFAKAYDAKPADIPKMWKNITRQQAKDSLSVSFNSTNKSQASPPRLCNLL
ncbi:hypothetical protein PAMA_014035 [Pampus argenteus]